jgi:hypothetical protein
VEEIWMMCPLPCSRIELLAQILLAQFLLRSEQAVTRVVHDDVEAAEVVLGLPYGSENSGLVGAARAPPHSPGSARAGPWRRR